LICGKVEFHALINEIQLTFFTFQFYLVIAASLNKAIENKTSEEYNTTLLYMGICALENTEYKIAASLLHTAAKHFKQPSDYYFLCQQNMKNPLHPIIGSFCID